MNIGEFVIKAAENRIDFLGEQKKDYDAAKARQKDNIIAELVRIEPSHLLTGWIYRHVERWQRDPRRYRDQLESAFLQKKGRDLKDESFANNAKLALKYLYLSERDHTSRIAAIRKSVPLMDDSVPDQAEKAIDKRIKRYFKKLKKTSVPYPYLGRDVCLNGNNVIIHLPDGAMARINVKDENKTLSYTVLTQDSETNTITIQAHTPIVAGFDHVLRNGTRDGFKIGYAKKL